MERTKSRHKKSARRTPSTAAKRVVVDIPQSLLDQAEHATRNLSINRSELIRRAVEHFVRSLQQAQLERELAEGYQANAKLDRALGEEFAAVDYDHF